MLAELPKEIASQFPILQYFLGFASVLWVGFAVLKSWRKTFAADLAETPQQNLPPMQPPNPALPQFYFDGPIVHAFTELRRIEDELRNLNRKVDDGFEATSKAIKRVELMIGSVSRSVRKLRHPQ